MAPPSQLYMYQWQSAKSLGQVAVAPTAALCLTINNAMRE
jgi:hypothetical protein